MSKENSYVDDHNMVEIQRIDEINESILFNGELHIKKLPSDPVDTSPKLMIRDSYWSKRYAVIRTGTKIALFPVWKMNCITLKQSDLSFLPLLNFLGLLLLYENSGDVYDEDKDPIDEISLENILVIESSSDDQVDNDSAELTSDPALSPRSDSSHQDPNGNSIIDCLFDVHARVQFGGDSNGIRVFSFYSGTTTNTTDWMINLCTAVGFLELLPAAGGGYVSVVSEAAIVERKELQLKRQVAMMRKGPTGPEGDLRRMSHSPLRERGNTPLLHGRGRGRGSAFRSRGAPMGGDNRHPDSLDMDGMTLSERRVADEIRKEKQMADVHRNHFKEVPLRKTGAGKGMGRGDRIRILTAGSVRKDGVATPDDSFTSETDYEEDSHGGEEHSSNHHPGIMNHNKPTAANILMSERPHSVFAVSAGRGGGRGRGRGKF